jgi:type VI protein secretion system component Hcp
VVIHVTSIINGQSKVTLEYELQDAIVAQYSIGSRASSDSGSSTSPQENGSPLERVCFSFAKISWTFHKMDALGNSQGKIQESYSVGS